MRDGLRQVPGFGMDGTKTPVRGGVTGRHFERRGPMGEGICRTACGLGQIAALDPGAEPRGSSSTALA